MRAGLQGGIVRTASFHAYTTQPHDAKMEFLNLSSLDSIERSGSVFSQIAVQDFRRAPDHSICEYIKEFVRWLDREAGSTSRYPFLPRGIAIVTSQGSDELALEFATHGIAVVESDDSAASAQTIAEPLVRLWQRFHSSADPDRHRTILTRSGQGPSTNSPPSAGHPDSLLSRTPSYFDPTLYNGLLEKLSTPWDQGDPWESES